MHSYLLVTWQLQMLVADIGHVHGMRPCIIKACYESLSSVFALACRHDAFFYFHNINAFESGDDLCIDLAAYKDNQIIVHLHRANLLFNLQPHAPAIPRRSESALLCGFAHWLVLTCLCCLPLVNCPLLIGTPLCLLVISLCLWVMSLHPMVIFLCLLMISLCLSAVGFDPGLVAFACLPFEVSASHLWSVAKSGLPLHLSCWSLCP